MMRCRRSGVLSLGYVHIAPRQIPPSVDRPIRSGPSEFRALPPQCATIPLQAAKPPKHLLIDNNVRPNPHICSSRRFPGLTGTDLRMRVWPRPDGVTPLCPALDL